MSKGRSKGKYCPDLDSSDTDSDVSEDTPSQSPNRSPEVVSTTRPGCNENVAPGGSYTAGISVGNVSEVKPSCTAGDMGIQQRTSEKPYGYHLGSLDKAKRLLMSGCVSDAASNTEATSSRFAFANVVNAADREPGKLFSVDEDSGGCSNHAFAHSIKSKSIKDVDRLPSKYHYSEESISLKSERVEKRTHQLPSGTASTLSQEKRDLLNCMKKNNLSKQDPVKISKNVMDREGMASSSASGKCNNFTSITNEIAAVTQNCMGVTDATEIGEQKNCSNAFQPLKQLDHGTRQKSAEKQSASSVLMREHNLPKAVVTKTNLYADQNKEQGLPNQNLRSGQLKSADEVKICSEQSFKVKVESEAIDKSAKHVDPLADHHIAESNSVKGQVSQNSSLIKCTSKSTVLQGFQINRKQPRDDLLTQEVESLKETLGNTRNPNQRTTCSSPADTGIQNLISAEIASDKHGERNARVDKLAGRNNRQSSHQQHLSSGDIEGKFYKEPPLKSGSSADLSLFTESSVKTVSKLRTSKSMQEFDQNLYVVHLLEKINPYNVEQLLQTSFEKLFSSVQQSLKATTGCVSLPWWNLHNDAKAIFVGFKTAVEVVEQRFKQCTCFPDADLRKELQTLQEINPKIPTSLPLSIRQFVQDQIKLCIKGYESRNILTRKGEFKAYAALVEVAADLYFDEMKFVVGDKYNGNNWLVEKHWEVFAETARHFLSAASFRHSIWETEYTGQLRDLLNSKYNAIQIIYIENREILVTKLAQVKVEMTNICQNSLVCKITDQSLLASEFKFDELGRAWKKESLKQFDVAIQEKIGSQYTVEINICRNQFERICDDVVNRERNNWIAQRDNARAARLKEKEEQEYKNKEKLKRKFEQQEKDKQELGTRKVTDQTPQNSAPTKQNCRHQKQGTTASATNLSSRFNSFSAGVDHFPLVDIAIYFGLSRTLVGIIKPQTDEFQLLADVENCLYFENHQLVAFSEEEKIKFGHGKGTSFACQIIQHAVGRVYDIEINGVNKPFRNEDFISFLFSAIKWHIEMKFGIRVSHSCVICLPQCLNKVQGQVVLVGAKIAGFRDVAFINDTNAMAMSCMTRNNILNETIIAVNLSEGFLDAGLFQVQNAFISTKAVAGHHFHHDSWGWHNYSNAFLSFFVSLKPETLDDMLSFNGKITPRCFPTEANVVVVGSNKEIAESVTGFYGLDVSEMRTPYYIIEGAAILAVLYHPESVLRQRWERMGNGKAFPTSFGEFLQNLQSEHVKHGMKSLNKNNGRLLTDDAYKMRKQKFFFQGKATFHERKMNLVNKCRQMKREVSNKEIVSKCGELDVTLVVGKLDSIEDAIRRIGITTSELMDLEKRLRKLFAEVYSMESQEIEID